MVRRVPRVVQHSSFVLFVQNNQTRCQLLSFAQPYRVLIRLELESSTEHMRQELGDVCDGRVQKLEEEQADVRCTLIGASKAEVSIQARLCEREAERVEQNDGLELHERHVLNAVTGEEMREQRHEQRNQCTANVRRQPHCQQLAARLTVW